MSEKIQKQLRRKAANVQHTPLTRTIRSEVHGINLNTDFAAASEEIYRLLLDRAVLVFRDQHLEAAAHLKIGRGFGDLALRHPLYPHVKGHDQIMVIHNDADHPPENDEWHSDLSFTREPSFVSVLLGVTIPASGGDTLWADMRTVHDGLSPAMQKMLKGLTATHSVECGFGFVRDDGKQQDRAKALNNMDFAANTASHPIIKRHPTSKRKTLYINESFTSHINELSEWESRDLLRLLCAQIAKSRFQLRVRWMPGTIVIWDNWATQHYACGDHYPAVRRMHRVTVVGNRRSEPFSATAQ